MNEAIRNRRLTIAGDFKRLREEGRKTRYTVTSTGKIQIQRKDDIRRVIKRSPDALDAASYGWHVANRAGPVRRSRRNREDEQHSIAQRIFDEKMGRRKGIPRARDIPGGSKGVRDLWSG